MTIFKILLSVYLAAIVINIIQIYRLHKAMNHRITLPALFYALLQIMLHPILIFHCVIKSFRNWDWVIEAINKKEE